MDAERKKRRRPPQKVRRVWKPEEWLKRTDWKRFSPANPKRQAYEIIRQLAKRQRQAKAEGTSWAEGVRPTRPRRPGPPPDPRTRSG